MRILHVIRDAAPVGGTQTHVLALARFQAARGDTVGVAHAGDPASLPPGVEETRADLEHAAAWRPDVVHLHGWPLGDSENDAIEDGFRVVRSLHDFSFSCASGERWLRGGGECARVHGLGCFVGLTLQGCSHRRDLRAPIARYADVRRRLPQLRDTRRVVVYSDYVRAIAAANGVRGERVRTIPYFVERPATPPAAPGPPNVAFVGRITRAKGLDLLLDALARRPEAWQELQVVGDGWDRARCERLAARHGIADRVRWHGWLAADDVTRVLEDSRVLALPSRWPEPFGIVGLEAMAAARPAVATAVGGIPEWLDDGETGLLVPAGDAEALADALARVFGDEELAARLGRTGWERAARFAPANHLELLDAVYSEDGEA